MTHNFTEIKNFTDAKKYLDSFVNYEKKNTYPYQKVLKLKRVQTLLNKLNISYHGLKAIHVAGTKGKGSTAHFCAYVLAASGYRVGLYTSPHFFDLRERIAIKSPVTSHQSPEERIKTALIAKKDVVRIVKEFRPHLEKLRFSSKLGNLSFFEVYTAIAFKYFLEQRLDFVVLETGLGGRLDATNVIRPLVSIITYIGYDHTDKLGKHLWQIASEKAGIIKKNIPVVTSAQRSSVISVIKRKCKSQACELFILNKDFSAQKEVFGKAYTTFDFSSGLTNLDNLKIQLKGSHQVANASLAIMAISLLKDRGIFARRINFRQGLGCAALAGRFEIICKNPLLILDIAHNPAAFSALTKSLKLYFPKRKIILIFAAARDKDIKNMLKNLPFFKIIITTFDNPRAFSPQEIKDICKLENALTAKDIKEALSLAKGLYKKDCLILVSGSLFLVSEAKKALRAATCDWQFDAGL